MPNENEGAQGATQTPAQPPVATPAAPSGLSEAQVQAMLDQRLATFKGDLTQEMGGVMSGKLEEFFRGRSEQPRGRGRGQAQEQTAPAAQPQPTAPTPAAPGTKDPAVLALETTVQATQARQVELEKQLGEERKLRESAEKEAKEAKRRDGALEALTATGIDPKRAGVAANYLLSQGHIQYGKNDGALYLVTKDASGQSVSKPLSQGITDWLNSDEGMVFRPALPSGSGGGGGHVSHVGAVITDPSKITEGRPGPAMFSNALRQTKQRASA